MGTITAIEVQKKRGDRRSIFVDGEFVAGAHEEIVILLCLRVGQRFDKEQLVELIKAETRRKARESALRLLSFRDRSIAEIRKRLIGSDFPEDIVEEVIGQLSQAGLLDDSRFSQRWVKSRTIDTSKPMGKARLSSELRAKGIEAPMVEEALGNLDEDTEYALAYSLAAKKIGKADSLDPSFRNRLTSFLRRRGFSWDVIKKVMESSCPEDQD